MRAQGIVSTLVRAFAELMAAVTMLVAAPASADRFATIERVRGSVVAIGTLERTRTPQFQFLGTGFAVGDGSMIVTNAHVLPPLLDSVRGETLAVVLPGRAKDAKEEAQVRDGKQIAIDSGSDLALVKIAGPPLVPLRIRDSDSVREGQDVFFTGFPIGAVLGPFPATHRGMISVVTPIAIPQGRAADLDPKTLRRLASGSFPVLQLDATAYPGNSGSPVYDPETGEVIGIINMVLVKSTKESALSQPSGITYAIPSRHLQNLLDKAR
ncbi:MAG TPA: serine protease [Casimicrobiaceae bacterium]|jgi:S1-C subfamily serine protease